MNTPTILALAVTSLALPQSLLAQGSLTPPGSPAPTMRSLQEIWDKIGALETTVASQQQLITSIQQQNTQQSNILNALAEANGLPTWQITIVDSPNVGQYTSLAFTPGGQPAISYYDSGNGDLKYAVFNGSIWTRSTVDSAGDVGQYTALAFTPGGCPAISYQDSSNGDLKYAVFDGLEWTVSTVVSAGFAGYNTSLAFTPGGQPAIAYSTSDPVQGTTTTAVHYAVFNGSSWTTTPVDSIISGVVNIYISLAFSPGGLPAICYQDALRSDLKFASFNGSNWVLTTVDGEGGYVAGRAASLAYTPTGQPAISYSYDDSRVKYAVLNGSNWTKATVYPAPYANRTSLAFAPDGQPAISYSSYGDGGLKYAKLNGGSWTISTVDRGDPNLGDYSSLAFTPGGQPAISYYDSGNGTLKFAIHTPVILP